MLVGIESNALLHMQAIVAQCVEYYRRHAMQTIDETLIVRGRKCVFHQRESQPTNTQIFTLARSG